MKVTIYDVAKEAGVSIATVSKVINKTGRISQSTRDKVQEAMKRLNYQPSVVASALTGKRTNTIGLLLPDISNPFFSEIARNIEDRAQERNMSVIMCSTDYNADKEEKYIELLQRKQVDGFIVASGFKNKNLLETLLKQNIPLVMLAQDEPSLNITMVSVDDYQGGYEATSHLLSLGHTDIAVIAEKVRSSDLRINGYRDALLNYGVSFIEDNIFKTVASISNGRKYALDLLDRRKKPSAIFACNDLIAVGVIQGARERGMNIPDDLSIIGFDNTILATITVPGLTTVAQPIEKMGRKIVDLIVEEINEENTVRERVLFMPNLILRGTTMIVQ